MGYTREYGPDKVRVMTLVKNLGKGGAVRMVRPAMSSRCAGTSIQTGPNMLTLRRGSFPLLRHTEGSYDQQGQARSDGRC